MKDIAYYLEAYNSLKKQVKYISKKYRDRFSCDADDFFRSGIKYDLFVNALSIVTNVLSSNVESQGIDNNCRAIIEAITILNLADDPDTYLDENRKELYRESYAAIEYFNNKEIFDILGTNINELSLNSQLELIERYSQIAKYCSDVNATFGLNMSIDDEHLRDQYIYLRKKSLSGGFNYRKLINKYCQNFKDYYHFFTKMIHPWCENDKQRKEDIEEKRENNMEQLLDEALKYLYTSIPECTIDNFDSAYSKIQNGERNLIINMETILNVLKGVYDSMYHMPPFILERINLIVKDMLLCHVMQQYESEITKFKSFIEMMSVFFYLLSLESIDERKTRSECFVLSTRARQCGPNVSNLQRDDPPLFNDISQIYDIYKKKGYTVDSLDAFIEKLANRWTSPFEDVLKIGDFVPDQISIFLTHNENEKELAKDILNLYDVSLDLEHACGYCFNASGDTLLLYSLQIVEVSAKISKVLLERTNCQISIETYDCLENIIYVNEERKKEVSQRAEAEMKNKWEEDVI